MKSLKIIVNKKQQKLLTLPLLLEYIYVNRLLTSFVLINFLIFYIFVISM